MPRTKKKSSSKKPKKLSNPTINLALITVISLIVVAVSALILKTVFHKKAYLQRYAGNDRQNIPTELSIAICDPANGSFSSTIDNQYFPLPVHGKSVLEEKGASTVHVTVLDETKVVAGVETRVVEEREWEDGKLKEVSQNYFAQAADGAVCYFGEAVDIYKNNVIVDHEGAWLAGVGDNKPGIFMPGNISVGQTYAQEIAPGVAEDRAEHVAIEPTYTTPAGTFTNVLLIEETPSSTKRYAPGVGLIYDAGAVLTSY